MKIVIQLTFLIILSNLSFSALSSEINAVKKMMEAQLAASCNDNAFLTCVGINENKCTLSASRAMSSCEYLFPKSMNAMSEKAMSKYGDCVSKKLLKNAGVTASKLGSCQYADRTPSMTDAQILDQVNQSMKRYSEAAGTGNVLPGRPYVGSNNFDRPEVVKKYAELVYHVAKHVSAHYGRPLSYDSGGGCKPGSVATFQSNRTVKRIYNNCYDAKFELPVTNGVMIGREISDSVTVTQFKKLSMSFKGNSKGYTIDGKIKATTGANGIDIVTNIGDVSFTYNLENETWPHIVTNLKYTKIYPNSLEIRSEEMFKISLSGKLYNEISAETIEPVKMGTGNNFTQIVSGKFKLSKGSESAIITFITPREILIEKTGEKPVKTDWYGDPTTIYWEIPLALKY
ncbi:MAG: hypothetical protein ACC641_03865 [Acidiferrobacterales bacterium]